MKFNVLHEKCQKSLQKIQKLIIFGTILEKRRLKNYFMKKLMLFAVFMQMFSAVFSQTEYVNPSIQRQNIYTVEIKDIIGTKEEFKFAFIIENKSADKYLIFELSKIAIAFSETDIYYPKNDEIIVVNPNSKERRTVKVVGNGNFQPEKLSIEFPRMKVNGNATDFANTENFGNGAEQTLSIGNYATAALSGLEWKKDAWSGEMLVTTTDFDGMLLLDLNKIKAVSPTNNAMPVEFKRDKLAQVALVSNDRFKSKFSIADVGGATLTNLQIAGAFKMYELRELDVPQITIKKVGYVEPTTAVSKNVDLCENFTNIQGLPVKVVIFNPNGICFKLASNGKKINENMCSNVEFDVEYGTQILTVALNNGQTVSDKIYPAEGDSYLVFEVIERKGEWKLQRKFDLSGDARKVEAKKVNTTMCKDKIMLDTEGIGYIRDVTVTKITTDKVFYIDCNGNIEKSIAKMQILAIEYPNGYYDKFDYPGDRGKQNMNLVRTENEVIELRNSSKTSDSFIIGPNRN